MGNLGCLVTGLGLGLVVVSTPAQPVPDAGSLLRQTERETAPPAARPAPPATQAAPASAQEQPGQVRFVVKSFQVQGASLVSQSDVQLALAPWLNRAITFVDLEQAATAVTALYRSRGWFVRPQFPAQDIQEGVVRLDLIEGKLGEVRIDDGGQALRLDPLYVRGLVTARQKQGDALQMDHLARSVNLLNDTPGVVASVSLAPGNATGESDVLVRAQDKPLWSGLAQLDNFGTRSTGNSRASTTVYLDNPSGQGNQGALNALATEGLRYIKLGYSIPWGVDGLRVGVAAAGMQYRLLRDFAALDAKGHARTLGVYGSYPWVRSGNRNVVLNAVLEDRSYHNQANGTQTSQNTSRSALLSLNGDSADNWGQGGFTLWSLSATVGRMDLSGNAVNQAADQAGARTEGGFHKLGFSLARLQRLSPKTMLWVSANGQFAGKNLDSSEKFFLGGPYAVRAYPSLEAQADSGWVSTLELRHNLRPEMQLIAFYDHGRAQVNHDASYAGAPALNRYALSGYGLGLGWNQPGSFNVRATVSHRRGENPAARGGLDSDGSKSATRVWLVATKYF